MNRSCLNIIVIYAYIYRYTHNIIYETHALEDEDFYSLEKVGEKYLKKKKTTIQFANTVAILRYTTIHTHTHTCGRIKI